MEYHVRKNVTLSYEVRTSSRYLRSRKENLICYHFFTLSFQLKHWNYLVVSIVDLFIQVRPKLWGVGNLKFFRKIDIYDSMECNIREIKIKNFH